MIAVAAIAGAVVWLVASGGVAVALGRTIRVADGREVEAAKLRHPSGWSDSAVREEFALLVPSFVTAETFALDAQINRRAQGWLV